MKANRLFTSISRIRVRASCLLFLLMAMFLLQIRVVEGSQVPASKLPVNRAEPSAHGTVVVGVAVAEGLVLVGDSRVTLFNNQWQPPYKIISDSSEKIAAIGNIGLATYGEAFILGRSISSWTQDFAFQLRKEHKDLDKLNVDQFLREFVDYFRPKVIEHRKQTPTVTVGFLVAGYDSNGVGRIYLVEFPEGKPVEQKNTKDGFGMTWEGETDTIQRIILGVDLSRLAALEHFRNMDEKTQKSVRTQLGQLEYTIFYNYLSLQDALDLANFLVSATVTMQRFSFGTTGQPGALPGVGGPVDSLVITPAGLKWVRHKQTASE